MTKHKIYLIGALLLLVAAVAAVAPPSACPVTREKKTVLGSSLTGLIENGDNVKLLRGYYKCHEIERNDVVAYQAGRPEEIIKIVAAVPGDVWDIQDRSNGHSIVVNGKNLTNPAGEEYLIDDRAARLLRLYVNDYKGVIPAESYLLLGTATTGAYDSTAMGLVGKADIVGKVKF